MPSLFVTILRVNTADIRYNLHLSDAINRLKNVSYDGLSEEGLHRYLRSLLSTKDKTRAFAGRPGAVGESYEEAYEVSEVVYKSVFG
jgi:hypothetical protein